MTASGVFGLVDLRLPAGTREAWLGSPVVIPDDWPDSLRTNTEYLPDADGMLPREVFVDATDLAAALRATGYAAGDVAAHEVLADGRVRLVVAGEIAHPIDVAGLVDRMRQRHRDGVEHGQTSFGDGGCAIEAYFADYDAFCFAFDLWMVPLVAAAKLGATGSGAFLFDHDCEEPVCFEIELADGIVHVRDVDPQNAQAELLPRWDARCEALRADYEQWCEAHGQS